jgi:hypothetical protein
MTQSLYPPRLMARQYQPPDLRVSVADCTDKLYDELDCQIAKRARITAESDRWIPVPGQEGASSNNSMEARTLACFSFPPLDRFTDQTRLPTSSM